MGLEDYSEKVEELEQSVESNFSRSRAHKAKMALDRVLPFVVLLIGFIVFFEFFVSVSSSMQTWITRANYALIFYFASRLAVSYRLSRSHERFIQDHWLDILLVVPVFSLVQETRFALSAAYLEDMPVFQRGVFSFVSKTSTAENAANAAKMTRITRIIKRSV